MLKICLTLAVAWVGFQVAKKKNSTCLRLP